MRYTFDEGHSIHDTPAQPDIPRMIASPNEESYDSIVKSVSISIYRNKILVIITMVIWYYKS